MKLKHQIHIIMSATHKWKMSLQDAILQQKRHEMLLGIHMMCLEL
jgi:hypothetical protein